MTMPMGVRDMRYHALKMAVQLKQRKSREEDVPAASDVVDYAKRLERYIKDGE